MEFRIAAIETDLRNVKENLAKLFDGMKWANDAIMKLMTGQAELRGDFSSLRTELKGDISSLHTELKADISSLRAELKADVGSLRTELKGDIGSLRTEFKADVSILRAEMGTLRAEFGGRLDALEVKIMRWFVATAFSCAGLAFAAARLFH